MMKRLVILFVLTLDLCVVDADGLLLIFSMPARAQHMELEGGRYDCHDDEIGWYKSPIPCDSLIVEPEDTYANCTYCHGKYRSNEILDHEYACPSRRKDEDPWNPDSGSGCGGSGSGGGGSSGSSGGGGGSAGGSSSNGSSGVLADVVVRDFIFDEVFLNVRKTTPVGMDAAACAGLAYQNHGNVDYDKFKKHLSEHGIYESIEIKGVCKENGFSLDNYESGFKCTILEKRNADGHVVGYICAYAGTDTDITELRQIVNDVSNDIWNYSGVLSAQYYRARNLSLFLKEYCDNHGMPLSFIGHSLGGGLAAISSIVTGCDAVTFNAAEAYCTRLPVLEWLGITEYNTSHIYAYVMDGEFLNSIQTADGTIIIVSNLKEKGPFDAHAIYYMFETLKSLGK